MQLTRLGRTNLSVSRIGLGLAALGRPGYINLGHADDLGRNYDVSAMQAQAHDVLDAAWQAGVRYFDAARSYGRAEEFLSSWLRTRYIAAESVTVGSKWGYTYTAGWRVVAEAHEVKEHSLPTLLRQIGESQRLLAPYLRLYQIHSATLESGVLENHAVLRELARLRAQGLVVGLTLSGPRQAETLERALLIETDGQRLFGSVQATWNLLERSAGPALQSAHGAGVGVIVKEALANGRLTLRNTDSTFAAQRRVLESLAQRFGASVDAVALAAVLAQPWVDVVLSGAATVEHLASNLRAQAIHWDDAATAVAEALREPPTEYWATRSRLPWG
jgi:aryl-alcohol dehydrogenase-like predicted oxidoreductase